MSDLIFIKFKLPHTFYSRISIKLRKYKEISEQLSCNIKRIKFNKKRKQKSSSKNIKEL